MGRIEKMPRQVLRWLATSHSPLVIVLTVVLLLLGVGLAWIAGNIFAPTPVIQNTDIVDPTALVRSVLVAFLCFLVITYMLARWCAWPSDKRLPYAIEYAYLLIGLISLIGIASYGIDKASYFRDSYAKEEEQFRVGAQRYITDVQRKSRCDYLVMGDPTGYCRWLSDAELLSNRPLFSKSELASLYAKGKRVINSLGDGPPDERNQIEHITGELGQAFVRTDVVRRLDNVISRNKVPSSLKLYAFYLLAFAAALRISKIPIEMRLSSKSSSIFLPP